MESKRPPGAQHEENTMTWTTPVLVEICLGLEINGYLPPEF
jgi:coenzyme PQQ precursor peptide PqqA